MALESIRVWSACGPRARRWRPPQPSRGNALTPDNMNQNIVKLQYAVRGPLVARAQQIREEIAKVGGLGLAGPVLGGLSLVGGSLVPSRRGRSYREDFV